MDLDATEPFDLVIVRGWRPLERLVDDGGFDGRIWSYLTDVPQAVTEMTPETTERLEPDRDGVPTRALPDRGSAWFPRVDVPQAAGKCVLFPPVVPALGELGDRKPGPAEPLQLGVLGQVRTAMEDRGDDAAPGPARRARHGRRAAHGR